MHTDMSSSYRWTALGLGFVFCVLLGPVYLCFLCLLYFLFVVRWLSVQSIAGKDSPWNDLLSCYLSSEMLNHTFTPTTMDQSDCIPFCQIILLWPNSVTSHVTYSIHVIGVKTSLCHAFAPTFSNKCDKWKKHVYGIVFAYKYLSIQRNHDQLATTDINNCNYDHRLNNTIG